MSKVPIVNASKYQSYMNKIQTRYLLCLSHMRPLHSARQMDALASLVQCEGTLLHSCQDKHLLHLPHCRAICFAHAKVKLD